MTLVSIEVDEEFNADSFWEAFDESFPEIAEVVRSKGETNVTTETWEEIKRLNGFADGPSYAPHALIEIQ